MNVLGDVLITALVYWVIIGTCTRLEERMGVHGCTESYTEVYREFYLRPEPYETYITVTESCGLFGWSSCQVQRRVMKTRFVNTSRLATRQAERCCEFWGGDNCSRSLTTTTPKTTPTTRHVPSSRSSTPIIATTLSPTVNATSSKSPAISTEHSKPSFSKQPTDVGKPGTNPTPATTAATVTTPMLPRTTTTATPAAHTSKPPTPSTSPTPRTVHPTVGPTGEPTPRPSSGIPMTKPVPQPSPWLPTARPTPATIPQPQPTPWIPGTKRPPPTAPRPTPGPTPTPRPSVGVPTPSPTAGIIGPTPRPSVGVPTPSPTPGYIGTTPRPSVGVPTPTPAPGTAKTPRPSIDVPTPSPKPDTKRPSTVSDIPTRHVPDHGSGLNVTTTASYMTTATETSITETTNDQRHHHVTTQSTRDDVTTQGVEIHMTSPDATFDVTTSGKEDNVSPTLLNCQLFEFQNTTVVTVASRCLSNTIGCPEDIKLYCMFDFYQSGKHDVRWYRDGTPAEQISGRHNETMIGHVQSSVCPSSRYTILVTLDVTAVEKTDLGAYVCIASTNGKIRAKKTAEIIEREPPKVSLLLQGEIDNSAAIATIVCLASLLIVSVFVVPCFVYRNRYLIKLKLKRYFGKCEDTDEKTFDVFVSYSPNSMDERFVVRTLVPKLESTFNMKVCVDYKEFLPGEALSISVIEAVESSRRTILVLSPRFIENGWCRFHFLSAQLEMFQSKHRIIPLIYQDISKVTSTDKDLRNILKIAKPVKWPADRRPRSESNFWKHLNLLLPKKQKPSTSTSASAYISYRSSGSNVNLSRWTFASHKINNIDKNLNSVTRNKHSASEATTGTVTPVTFEDLSLNIEASIA